MSKKLIGFFLIIIVIFIGAFLYNNDLQNHYEDTLNYESIEVEQKELTDSKDGVTVTVTDVKIQNGKTIAMITLNNHVYDISSMDVENLSSFSDMKPSNYKILSKKMGGHHVESEMTFDEELSGELIIGLNDDLVFNFNVE